MYKRVEFLAPEDPAGDWLLEVRIDGVMVGRIRRHPWAETYRYYRITTGEAQPFHEEGQLEDLLKLVSRWP